MSRAHPYISDLHDAQLTFYHRMGLDDYEICERWYADEGKRFSAFQVAQARRRLRLPITRRLPFAFAPSPVKIPEDKPSPLVIAQHWLGTRLVEKPSGYFLDGIPVNTTTIMRATNEMRKNSGQKQIGFNEQWLVP